ncbi:MAG: hypothetical protein ACE5DI_05635 [Candidatus Micrarchaeia archaeon]
MKKIFYTILIGFLLFGCLSGQQEQPSSAQPTTAPTTPAITTTPVPTVDASAANNELDDATKALEEALNASEELDLDDIDSSDLDYT